MNIEEPQPTPEELFNMANITNITSPTPSQPKLENNHWTSQATSYWNKYY